MLLLQLTAEQLRRAADLKEQIEALQQELQALLGSAPTVPAKRLHWTQTPEGKARLAKSMRKSWQKRGSGTGSVKAKPATDKKPHWTQTPAGRIKMDEIRRRRWQKR